MSLPRYQVIVIGGGIAGLSAADALLALLPPPVEGERSVLVLEKARRLGGRIATHACDDGTFLEEGASYFGPRQPHMRRLVERFHPGAMGDPARVHHHDFPAGSMSLNHIAWANGLDLDIAFASEETFSPSVAARRVVQRMETITRHIADVALDEPWARDPLGAQRLPPALAELDTITLAQWIERELTFERLAAFYGIAKQMVVMFTRTILSSEPRQMSALYFFWYLARCGGGRDLTSGVVDGPDSLRLAAGYGSLIEGLRSAIAERQGEVRTEVPVPVLRKVDGAWCVPGVAAAPHVIVAVPPQAITDHLAFEPGLPSAYGELHAAMKRGQGRTIKGYLRYPSAWWERYRDDGSKSSKPVFLSRELARIARRYAETGRLTIGLDYVDAFPGGHSGYTNGTSEDLVWTMPATWRYADGKKNPSLLWFIVGDAYERYKHLAPAQQKAYADRVVKTLFDRSAPEAAKDDVLVHDWHQDGGYGGPSAVLGVGELTALGHALRTPHDGIHFACTETARAWGGYMDGAIESGVRAAHEVVGSAYDVVRPSACGMPSVPIWWEKVAQEVAPATHRAGFAVQPLTLLEDKPMAGYAALGKKGRNGSERLEARALYLETPGASVVFCVVDLMSSSLALTRRVTDALRRDARLAEKFRDGNVIIAGTHTHYAPARFYGNSFYDAFAHQFIDVNPLVGGEYAGFDWVGFDEEQVGWLVDDICRAIRGAVTNARPAMVGVGVAPAWGAASNRSLAAHEANDPAPRARWRGMVQSLDDFAAQRLEPEQLAVDPRVTVIAAFDPGDPSRPPIGALATLACHGTALGGSQALYSADWFGHARARARDRGVGNVALGVSAGGDASPLPPNEIRRGRPAKGAQGQHLAFAVGAIVGDAIALAAAKARMTASAQWLLEVKSGAWQPDVRWGVGLGITAGAEDGRNPAWPLSGPYEGRRSITADPVHGRKWGLGFTRALLDKIFGCRPSAYHPLYLVRVGDHLLWTAPGEPTLMAGEQVSQRLASHFEGVRSVSVLSHAGDYAGYFTTEPEYAAQHYEATHTLYGTRTLQALEARLVAIASAVGPDAVWPSVDAPVDAPTLAAALRRGRRRFAAWARRPALLEDLIVLRADLPRGAQAIVRQADRKTHRAPVPFGRGVWIIDASPVSRDTTGGLAAAPLHLQIVDAQGEVRFESTIARDVDADLFAMEPA